MKLTIQILLFVISVFVLTGCGISQKSMILHKDTIIKESIKKNMIFKVDKVILKGDLPNPTLYMFTITDKDINQALIQNLKNFYQVDNDNSEYQIICEIDFTASEFTSLDKKVIMNATYKIYKNHKNLLKRDITSKYIAKVNIAESIAHTLAWGVSIPLNKTTDSFKNVELEKIGYPVDKSVTLTSSDGAERLKAAYAGAIRINFAKFLQELQKISFLNEQ